MKHTRVLLFLWWATSWPLAAQVPQLINYQGRVSVGSSNFDGTGQFKFALVSGNGGTTYWSNNGTSSSGSEPSAAVPLPVVKGIYSVLLGDPQQTNMTTIPSTVFNNPDVRLRVWFSSGGGSQLLSPDQRIAAVGYAMIAANVQDGAITSSKLAAGAVTSASIAAGAVTSTQLASSSVDLSRLSISGAPVNGQVLSYNGSGLAWAAGGGGSGPFSLNGTSVYYNGGRLGLGTSSPGALLELNSPNGNNMLFVASTRPNIIFRDQWDSPASDSVMGGWSGGFRFYTKNFWNSSDIYGVMAYDANGRLGIGTATPTSALHIFNKPDAIRLTGAHPYITFDDTAAGLYSRIEANGAGLDLKTQGATTGSNPGGLIHLDGVGSVGLGTTTPKAQLSIINHSGTPGWTSAGWLGSVELPNGAAIGWRTNAGSQRFGLGHTNGGFFLFRASVDPGTTGGTISYDLGVYDNGSIGIGTSVAPTSKLEIAGQDALTITGYQPLLTFRDSNAGNARTRIQSVSGEMNFFTESYLSGSNLNNYAKLFNTGIFSVKTLTIRGGADLAEPFPMSHRNIPPGAVVVIDEQNPGKLRMSRHPYDKKVAGIVSGAGGIQPGISMIQEDVLEPGENVSLSGRIYVKANRTGGAIEPGDALTTSAVPGEAMKAADPARAQGAILGKAMTRMSENSGLVLILVTLQ